ncbi:MAG: LPS export ABC transporter permease LptG [Candidatus Thioglobus sp.]|nr:LPS export ABC transporter permease LptG [Candidatus Thioglobus sp.]
MKILERYIVKTMAFYVLAVLFIWLCVYGFLNFINEVDDIGVANYTTLKAMIYVAMDLPAVAYSHSSMIILLGSLLAFGHLSSTSQLIIARASGLSILQIAQIVVKAALFFAFIIIIFGELVVPISTQSAEGQRKKALGINIMAENQQGFWLKDGDFIINVKENFDGKFFKDIMLINTKKLQQLDEIIQAQRAVFDGENLHLEKIKRYKLNYDNGFVGFKYQPQSNWTAKVSFDRSLINGLEKEPYELSTWNLYQQIDFLTNNNLIASAFEVEFYKRLVRPITLATMILFSLLFVFGSLRDASMGRNIFIGLVISLCFELISRIGGVLSLRFDYNHAVTAFLPTLIALVLVLYFLRMKSSQ